MPDIFTFFFCAAFESSVFPPCASSLEPYDSTQADLPWAISRSPPMMLKYIFLQYLEIEEQNV